MNLDIKKSVLSILTIALTMASLSACSEDETFDIKDLDKPITATTVDECVEEIQCAWDYFKNIALGNEYGEKINKIRKWDKNVRSPVFLILNKKSDSSIIKISKQLIKINSLSSLESAIHIEGINKANSLIAFTDNLHKDIHTNFKKDYETLGQYWHQGDKDFFKKYISKRSSSETSDFKCFGNLATLKQGQGFDNNLIFRSYVFIPQDDKGSYSSRCLFEEVTQSFGIINDYQDAPFTIFSDTKEGSIEPTKLDWLLLTILYHPSVKIGMNQEQVKKVFLTSYKNSLSKLNKEMSKW